MSALVPVCAVLGWAACSVGAYFVIRHVWTREFDFTRSDRAALVLWSLFGPASLFVALVELVVGGRRSDPRLSDEVLIPRRRHDR